MTHQQFEELKHESSIQGKDPKTRRLLIFAVVLWLITLAALVGVSFNAYFNEREKSVSLAQQIAIACESGELGADVSPEDVERICDSAKKVIENAGEIQDDEVQEREIQEREIQEPEFQEPEKQNPESQDIETQDAEEQETEEQDGEIQDPEIQDDETQDPEIDDPDPNDQIESGSCTFDGTGTFTLTFQTSSGPVTTTCTGTGTPPGQIGN